MGQSGSRKSRSLERSGVNFETMWQSYVFQTFIHRIQQLPRGWDFHITNWLYAADAVVTDQVEKHWSVPFMFCIVLKILFSLRVECVIQGFLHRGKCIYLFSKTLTCRLMFSSCCSSLKTQEGALNDLSNGNCSYRKTWRHRWDL